MTVLLMLALVLAGSTGVAHSSGRADGRDAPAAPASYAEALHAWTTAEDISAWAATYFSYDISRAMRLSETQRAKEGPVAIYTPGELFDGRTGVCVDLARLGVETLRRIDPRSDPRYLMVEFEPARIAGNILRRHWLVTFRREGKLYVFLDSERPGHVAGPYDDAAQFIREYEQYRRRAIVTFREAESYQKQRRARVMSQEAPGQLRD